MFIGQSRYLKKMADTLGWSYATTACFDWRFLGDEEKNPKSCFGFSRWTSLRKKELFGLWETMEENAFEFLENQKKFTI